jgi:hypothetical protein
MDVYNCLNCKKELIKARNTRKFCSDKCRVYFHRKHSVTDSVTDVTVADLRNAKNALDRANVSVTDRMVYDPETDLVYSNEE